ncbi:hypothetical protein Tco_0892621 [Tanacetum coccineum]|uniref:Reverse transcriptase domain-containing protein n=1 Tax=Tanacetum coccineum TaxID=301880 RepID=A0ABQ5C800_9ASTR
MVKSVAFFREQQGSLSALNKRIFFDYNKNSRLIQDNNLLSRELLRGYDRKDGPNIVAMKIDIQKAYDIGGRGLRQDDLLMFCHGDIVSVSVIKEAIKDFGVIFGLLPNYCKSSIIFGSISMEDKQYILDSVCFKVEKLPVKYLGVPITSYIGTCHNRLNLSLSDISGANPSSNDFPVYLLSGGEVKYPLRWTFNVKRYMKKLKVMYRNKANALKVSIAGMAVYFSLMPNTLKKVTWYVLHNSLEIDTYRSQFKSKFPNKDMKEEFPNWFGSQIRQRHVDNDPGVSATSELFALACGPTPTPISVNSCVVNGVRFVVHSRDERRTTQNSGICSPGGKDGEMYYGQLQEILEFLYLSFKVVLFRVKWFDTSNEGRKVKHLVLRNNMTQILTKEEDPDVIHFDNSSDLPLSTSLSDLDNATLHIDGQSTEVDAPPDIIDLDEDDDIIDDEDALPHDLADSDDEDLVNVDDDDGVEVMSADVARGHGGDGGGDDRPPTHHIPTGYGGCFVNRGKGTRKPNLGGRKAGRLHTRQETRNLGLKKITDDKGPVPIRFEWDDKKTMMPLGDHASHWSNYLGELIREMPLYYPSWQKVPAERKAAIVTKIGTQFDLTPHMQSQPERCPQIYAGIQQHLQKIYNGKKAALKERYWVPEEDGP